MYDVSLENKRLSEPLAKAQKDVGVLKAQLRDRDKDRMSLRNAKARLVVLDGLYTELQDKQFAMEEEFRRVEQERDELYASFETSVRRMQEQSDLKNVLLEQKIQSMENSIDQANIQAHELVSSANLDPAEVSRMTQALDNVLLDKNKMTRELQYMVIKAAKVTINEFDRWSFTALPSFFLCNPKNPLSYLHTSSRLLPVCSDI